MTPQGRSSRAVLRDREAELATIERAVRRARGARGSLLLVDGPAGIGKTALLEAAVEMAEEHGLRRLAARGSEIERAFGFGVARQLLAPVLDRHAGSLGPVSARLVASAIAGAPPDREGLPHGPDASFAILNALHQLVVEAVGEGPLLASVDDAHLADPASTRFLAYLGARVRELPVCLIVAVRSPPAGGQAVISGLLSECGALVLKPRPLSAASARALIRAEVPRASDAVCAAASTASGGNPFFLHELGEALRAAAPDGPADVGDAVAVLSMLPTGVLESVRARIHRLPGAALALARGLAVMGDGSLLRHGAAISGLDMASASAAADALVAAEILAPERPMRFLHPLIHTAVYNDLPPGERGLAHAAAAALLAGEDAAPERVAAHLLAVDAGTTAGAAGQLRDAARVAVRRGAPEAAVTYLRRALEEPLDADVRPVVLLELGEAEALTQNPQPAAAHLRRALDGLASPGARLRAALILAEILGTDGRSAEGVAVLERALYDGVGAETSPRQIERIEAHLTNIARSDIESRQRSLATAAALRRRARDGRLSTGVALTAAAAEEAMAGISSVRTHELAGHAIAALDAEGTFPGEFTMFTAVRCLLACDRFAEARTVILRAREQARLLGAIVAAATTEVFLGDLYLRTGEIAAGITACQEALRRASDGWGLGIPAASALLAEGLLARGELDAAAAAITDGGLTGAAAEVGSSYVLTMLLHARGRVRLAAGDAAGGLDDLLETGRRQNRMAEPNPALMPWRSSAARALAGLGRREEARALAAEEVTLARRFGAPSALARALVSSGEITGAEAGESALAEAVALLRGSPAQVIHAEALCALGELRCAGPSRPAGREALTEGLHIATACGAVALQARAVAQLRAAGARPRRFSARGVDALTASERRVAGMAARGMSNREIADEMVVSVRTVEFHLRGTFRKLGVGSRGELPARALGVADPAAAAPLAE